MRKQFCLSTAVAMMLLAGALLGLNLRAQHDTFKTHEFTARGWPCWWLYDETEASKTEHAEVVTQASPLPISEHSGSGYSGTDAAYLADESARHRRGIDESMVFPRHSETDGVVAELTKLTEKFREQLELVDHTSTIKHNFGRNVALDSLCAVLSVLIPGVLLEILMRKMTATRETASRRESELPYRPSS